MCRGDEKNDICITVRARPRSVDSAVSSLSRTNSQEDLCSLSEMAFAMELGVCLTHPERPCSVSAARF